MRSEGGNSQSQRLGRFDIDEQFELCCLHHRKSAGFAFRMADIGQLDGTIL